MHWLQGENMFPLKCDKLIICLFFDETKMKMSQNDIKCNKKPPIRFGNGHHVCRCWGYRTAIISVCSLSLHQIQDHVLIEISNFKNILFNQHTGHIKFHSLPFESRFEKRIKSPVTFIMWSNLLTKFRLEAMQSKSTSSNPGGSNCVCMLRCQRWHLAQRGYTATKWCRCCRALSIWAWWAGQVLPVSTNYERRGYSQQLL